MLSHKAFIQDIITISAKAKLDVKGLFEQIKRQTFSEAKQERLRKDAAEIKSSLRRLRTQLERKGNKTTKDELKLQKPQNNA
mmetsp:Transcript_32775/g.45731  ORF Transcript_32775/g.45731 Transcript_32775/m.45731 type:complete len:82 (+) Transcript_32775:221-466(+)